MKLADAYSDFDWLLVLYDANKSPVLLLILRPGESIESQAERLYDRAKELGLLNSLLSADTYPGSIGPRLVLEGLRAKHETFSHSN